MSKKVMTNEELAEAILNTHKILVDSNKAGTRYDYIVEHLKLLLNEQARRVKDVPKTETTSD